MSEELLKAIIQLFAIVTRERITDEERNDIKEFLALHLNRDAIKYYLNLFDEFANSYRTEEQEAPASGNIDVETQQFVDDWAKIMQITKKVNQALTVQQKLVLIVKIIELVFGDNEISERHCSWNYTGAPESFDSVLIDGSPERRAVEAAGWQVAEDGMEISL